MININDLIGLPFSSDVNKAYGPDSFSCYGILWEVYRRCGIEIPKSNIAGTACKEASNQEMQDHIDSYWRKIDELEVPCAVVIKATNPKFCNHVAAYIGDGKMVHVTLNKNVCVDKVKKYQRKIIGYYQYTLGEN